MDKKNIFFERFVAKVLVVNPNLEFKEKDWIHGETNIDVFCKLHNKQFKMERSISRIFYNCKECKKENRLTPDQIKEIKDKIRQIDDEYKDKRKEYLIDRYVKDIKEDIGIYKVLDDKHEKLLEKNVHIIN